MSSASHGERWVLSLYVAGSSPCSLRAIRNLRRICEDHLPGRHAVEIVDLYQHPSRAAEADLVCAPTLVKRRPPPVRRLVGDLSNEGRVLVVLRELQP